MNRIKFVTIILALFAFHCSFFDQEKIRDYTGVYKTDFAILEVVHSTDPEHSTTTFSIRRVENEERNLLKAEVIANGESFVFVNAFVVNGGRLDPEKKFKVKGFPETITLNLHYSLMAMSHAREETHRLSLDLSDPDGNKKGVILIREI